MARLRRGEAVREHLYEMLQRCIQDNLLDVHPPFQIDGNFGIPEAVLECVAQCHGKETELLPWKRQGNGPAGRNHYGYGLGGG